jgi:hypothetical protein
MGSLEGRGPASVFFVSQIAIGSGIEAWWLRSRGLRYVTLAPSVLHSPYILRQQNSLSETVSRCLENGQLLDRGV